MKNKKTSIGESNFLSAVIKIIIVVLLVIVQLWFTKFILNGTYFFAEYATWAFEACKAIAILYIIYKNDNPAYKIAWIIVIMALPVLGILAYFLYGNNKFSKKNSKNLDNIKENSNVFEYDNNAYSSLKDKNKTRYKEAIYIKNTTAYPVYANKNIEYFKVGEEYFDSLIQDIKKAKSYIFLEYFIISKSSLWDEIFNLLKQKVKDGVKVYLMVDQMGSIFKFPKHFKKDLVNAGINVTIFNPLVTLLNSRVNYRDHRKITVIDGKVAYNGGLNIGDEYINKDDRLGHWKDTGIKVTGEAVLSYVVMFLRMWEFANHDKFNFDLFMSKDMKNKSSIANGYIMFYGDGPDNNENQAENIYLSIIQNAKDYVYITTPYLIIDNELITALTNAAKSGVDVRIVTPFIPDKKFVQITTRSFYDVLLDAGVKIYEYKPGFIHAKMFVADDEVATVGTINLDFRSLYLHFECGTWMYKTGTELKVKADILDSIEKSIEIDPISHKKRGLLRRGFEAVLKTFSPML